MPSQPDEVLLSLQSSLRNALASFGPGSKQYLMIKYMIDEYEAKLALQGMSLSTSDEMQQ
ncbi:hypothetical protein N0V91_003887 [Didymella pomorum]|uniref:Uncharacterized protein n=1 Tax=Didymella pomorum TaxID=749634 RepID=A0A9W8ZK74_9PLEO|nr:hypothetical protein N0V91_003887 [Didymella pomorum]